MTKPVPLSTASLFELYKKEKAVLDDELNPFPTFSVWKLQYAKERADEMDAVADSVKSLLAAEEALAGVVQKRDETTPKPTTPPVLKVVKKKKLTNMDKARTIFQQMVDESDEMPIRKDVMAAFMKQLKVSSACASTYHHNIKQKYN